MLDCAFGRPHAGARQSDLVGRVSRQNVMGEDAFFLGRRAACPCGGPEEQLPHGARDVVQECPVPPENIHPIPTTAGQPDEVAREYEQVLRTFLGETGPTFDVLFLGVGVEGHTASLFPESPALNEQKKWVVAVRAPVQPQGRISLTFPVLRRARATYFLVAGADKRGIVATLRRNAPEETQKLPVAMLQPEGEVIWFLDNAADGGASRTPA